MPAPTLATAEIRLVASTNEHEALANNVVMLANQYGGSAAKGPPDEAGITVLADLPALRAGEFRQALAPLAAADFSSPMPSTEKPPINEGSSFPASHSEAATARVNIYVRITQALGSPGP